MSGKKVGAVAKKIAGILLFVAGMAYLCRYAGCKANTSCGVDVDVVTTSGEEAFNEVGGRWDWEFEEFEG